MNNRTQMNRSIIKQAAGFTLIELVIVVVILGFLAVTAIPKFLDLTEQAKQANIEGMAGGFATGVSLARAQWEAEARPTENGVNRVDYDGVELFLTTPGDDNTIRPGYPTGINSDKPTGADMDTTDCIEVWQGILAQPPTITDDIDVLNDDGSINYFVIVNTNLCGYFLRETLVQGDNGVFTAPTDDTVGNNFFYNNANSSVVVNINKN
ncbi:pilus assembly FimT family protein [Candidatus Colwellia aromaticivorans]|uniref:pilus assembly FimT family protein n=1 Tax=Candidatus Colwellia aromaticivorans TaxID=2267621 RepID=UPI001FEA732C|nr:prepilin-type N-terminal cleavage/methylation domain-containing protein [Candidatus Colwellia aromaticivorans]